MGATGLLCSHAQRGVVHIGCREGRGRRGGALARPARRVRGPDSGALCVGAHHCRPRHPPVVGEYVARNGLARLLPTGSGLINAQTLSCNHLRHTQSV